MIFLDSDVIIELLNRSSIRSTEIIQTLEKYPQIDFAITSIAYEEVLFGVYKKLGVDTLSENHPLLRFPVVEFSKEDAEVAASLENKMEHLGSKKPRGDILIASAVIK